MNTDEISLAPESTDTDEQPLTLYGSVVSYFTGKLENYLRVKGVPYRLQAMQMPGDFKKVKAAVGVEQMPAIQLADGRWMTDSSKIIQWFEAQSPAHSLIPDDPVQAFLCFLIEDYADEWLWRPAMHYRWHYPVDAQFASRTIVDEMSSGVLLPSALKRLWITQRQRRYFTTGDGVMPQNIEGVERIYLRLLEQLQAIFEQRDFILGDKPSLADIGLAGPFFRHFAFDPIPLEILRNKAPAVLEWVARLWNTRIEQCHGRWLEGVPEDLTPLLNDIGQHYLPYLNANAAAVERGQSHFDVSVAGVDYRGARASRYRVWCLAQLRERYERLPNEAAKVVRDLLEENHCWEPLWSYGSLPLLAGQEQGLPFSGDNNALGIER